MKTQLFNHKRPLLTALLCAGLFCTMSSTMWAQPDLWIADNVGDTGNEPNTTTSVFWASPDIGVSWPLTNSPLKPNPSGGAVNWVHVKVQNRGNATSNGTDKVHVYYSAASMGLSWSTQWINYTSTISGCTAPVFGDEIGSASVPPLAPGGTADVIIQWWAPDPTTYGCLSQPNHFCMIARIVPGITYTETTNIVYNTQYNNNIAWRNWYVVKLPPGPVNPVPPATVIARNVREVPTTMTLRAALVEEADNNIFENATVDIAVDDELFEKWQANGAQGENIEIRGNGIIRMMNADAWIGGIPMEPGETHEAGFQFTRTNDDFTGTAQIDMIQEDDGDITGGERFEVDFSEDDGSDGLVTGAPDETNIIADDILVYPNPSQTEFTISSADKSAGYSVRVFDATGREVYSTKFSGEVKINVENFPKGTYYIEMSNALAGTKTTKQIVVK